MDFVALMGAASHLYSSGQITIEEWRTINAIANNHDWKD